MSKRNWYDLKAASGTLSLSIHDEIGAWGVSVSEFAQSLKAEKDVKNIELSIHSPGGSALDGLAMYHMLKNHPAEVHAEVVGIAASAATTILMAADHISMPADTFLMVHNPWMVAAGDTNELREIADTIEKIKNAMANIYASRTGQSMEAVHAVMDAETWMTAEEAVELGYADFVSGAVEVAALSNDFAKHFSNIPDRLIAGEKAVTTLKECEAMLRESAGLSRAQAFRLVQDVKRIAQSDSEEINALQNKVTELEEQIGGRAATEQLCKAIASFEIPTSL